jgi:ADP-ribose pyrophosphatase YjhB (NUDIX family)
VLVTPANQIVTIRRERPGTPAYWVLPGGHVEPTDADREGALHRELAEEIAATATIHSLILVIDSADEYQYFYLARVHAWSFADRSGPEFTEPGRGIYDLDLVPFTATRLASISLKPDPIAKLLAETFEASLDPFSLPDRRAARAGGDHKRHQ